MNMMNDIYRALMDAKQSIAALETWVRGADGRDLVRNRSASIDLGIAAYERLQSQLRDGRRHIEPPEDYKITSCQCGAPNAAPPCSWCTRDTESEK
jgi:hypothetical protein